MKNQVRYSIPCAVLLVLLAPTAFGASTAPTAPANDLSVAAEDFKGKPSGDDFTVAGMTGLGLFDSHGALALVGAAGKRVLEKGFVPGIVNPVFIEAELGPLFLQGTAVFSYGVHLRWDFEKDDLWTFYALGGFGGLISGDAFGNHSEFFPRFGAGLMYRLQGGFAIRGEISHELILAGVSFSP